MIIWYCEEEEDCKREKHGAGGGCAAVSFIPDTWK
jgi:hypothetical protein